MENSIRQILEAKSKQELLETSLSRILRHVQDAKEKGFSILTSWRQANDKKTNLSKFVSLKQHVRGLGLGFIQLEGHWVECQDSSVPYEECPKELLVNSVEPSLMVFGIKLKEAMELGKQFDQDAVLYAGPETQGQVQLHFRDGSTMNLGEFNPQAIGQAYSTWRKKKEQHLSSTFTFEGYSYPSQSYLEKLAEINIAKKLATLQNPSKE